MLAVILIIVGLIVLHGFFAGAEVAVDAVPRTRVRELVEDGRAGARSLERMRGDPERTVASARAATLSLSIAAGVVGGGFLAHELEPHIGLAPAILLGIAAIGLVMLVAGELVPMALALRRSERWALWSAVALRIGAFVFRPLIVLSRGVSNSLLSLSGGAASFGEARVAPEELQEQLEEAGERGTIDPGASHIASRAIDFGELTAGEVMVPRNRVEAISKDLPASELREVLLEHGHSRMPVYAGSIDEIIGYISIKDVLAIAWDEKLFVMEDLLRPAFFVPETMRAIRLLRLMQRRRVSLAIVVEESGGLAGIATVEDLVEELVGEIYSEEESMIPEAIHLNPDRTALVLGIAQVRDVNRELDLDLPEGDGWSTVAGLCLELAGRIPAKGERLLAPGGTVLEVMEASARRVRTVRVHLPAPPA
ncbi:MAG TPA: hemolysin family protein [Vulgatibacter sp.]